ncbi:MAG: RNB domain-containing ribonuclease [Myxococcales bacterium]|nr:RNB domain-containing ribonuclease [Myxococcales bacterium]
MTLIEEFRALARAEGLEEAFPPAVLAEVERLRAAPGLDDPALADLRALPFVTIDGPLTRDLDQAVYVEPRGDRYRLLYAIADAAYYVAPGTALLAEALRRGASFYFPGFSIPMLPRALSEGLVSLNADCDRRALVFDVALDAAGGIERFVLTRARIRSRQKLTFDDVEGLLADPKGSPLARAPFAGSLRRLCEVGDKRVHHEDRKQMVRFQRAEAEVSLAPDGSLVVAEGPRGRVELANEQVSILCNALGARLLAESDPAQIQPIYRVHAPPEPERVATFERLVGRVAKARGLPDDPWLYRRAAEAGLAGYLEALPSTGPGARLARALHRQAMLLNGRSVFQAEPSAHFGVGEAIYARFTAPMREMVGVFCHKEALERLGKQRSRPRAEDEALRTAVIEAANRSKDIQRRLAREVDRRVVRALLEPDLARPVAERPLRRGTVMGIAGSKVHVLLDHPPIDVKVALRDQGAELGGAWLEGVDEGEKLVVKGKTRIICRLGDEVNLRAIGPDAAVMVDPPGSPEGASTRAGGGPRRP